MLHRHTSVLFQSQHALNYSFLSINKLSVVKFISICKQDSPHYFTHVYFLLLTVIDCPTFLHTDPGFGAVAACAIVATNSSAITGGRTRNAFLM